MATPQRKAPPKTNGFVHWRKESERDVVPSVAMIPCVDGRYHRYLNANAKDIDRCPPARSPFIPCPSCGYALAELQAEADGSITVRACSECRGEAGILLVQEFEAESGVRLVPVTPDHASLRQRCNYRGRHRYVD